MPQKILLIDDSPVDRVMYRSLLSKNVPGLVFEEASNAREGLSLLRLSRYDCVFLDYLMPDGNGLEVLSALDRNITSPIIMLTGTDDTDTAVEALKAGARDYLVKDRIDTGTIVSALQGALMDSSKSYAQDAVVRHNARLEAALQQSEVAVLLVDLASLQLVEASAVGLARLGYRRADVTGRDVRTLELFGGKEGWERFIGSLKDGETVDWNLMQPGGKPLAARVRSGAVKIEGKPYLLAYAFRA
jgi:DNA-binding NarL/FixJ family response regulator